MVAVESRRELLYKCGTALVLIAIFLALGVHSYVLNLFMYTPQMYYTRAFVPDFYWMFVTSTSVLFRYVPLGWGAAPLLAFFGLAVLGAFFALRYGTRFARRLVFGALALEIFIIGCGVLNLVARIAPLNLFYAEVMGLTVAALLAGTGVWGLLLSVTKAIAERAQPLLTKSPLAAANGAYRSYSFLLLLLMVGYLFYLLSGPGNFVGAWPPATDSVPAQIQAKELAIKPGDDFKGRAIVLLATQKNAPAHWVDVFNVVVYKVRAVLGNDLMNDAKVAGIPVANEYGHWLSPPMLALLSVGFYRPEDHIGRAAQTPRAFHPNLARLMGVLVRFGR